MILVVLTTQSFTVRRVDSEYVHPPKVIHAITAARK